MDRKGMLAYLEKVASPVLEAAAEGRLLRKMETEQKPGAGRERFSGLEAVGRLLCGIAPWLEAETGDEEERALRAKLRGFALLAIDGQTNPKSSDYAGFDRMDSPYNQVLVDTAFLAQGLLRAPNALLNKLDGRVRGQVVNALLQTRRILPCYSNWLLFSGMVEAALYHMTGEIDVMRLNYVREQFEQWYLGDGFYSDGPRFAMDYYNSYVIHPMLMDIAYETGSLHGPASLPEAAYLVRAQRYAAILERMIAPDGSFIAVGRSIAYRCGAFHLLAQLAAQHGLPEGLSAPGVRCALSAVIERTLGPESFREDGFLRIGLCGGQPGLGEGYISTGSLYLCAAAFLPLGLAAEDEFWAAPDQDWTQKRLWRGEDMAADHKLEG